MSLLAASPLLSSLFLTYANRAATLDGPPNPSPIDLEWTEMKSQNNHLQEEVVFLRAQLAKETERAKTAEDCVDALRSQLSSVKDANNDLDMALSREHARFETITSQYEEHKKKTGDTITELRNTVDKEAGARAALSQVIADQQITLAQLKEQNGSPSPSPATIKERPSSILARISATPGPPTPISSIKLNTEVPKECPMLTEERPRYPGECPAPSEGRPGYPEAYPLPSEELPVCSEEPSIIQGGRRKKRGAVPSVQAEPKVPVFPGSVF